jgi:IS5 family transposase
MNQDVQLRAWHEVISMQLKKRLENTTSMNEIQRFVTTFNYVTTTHVQAFLCLMENRLW